MKIFTTTVFFSDDTQGNIYTCDTIEYEGRMWLVPHWLESPSERMRMPVRIVLLDVLPHQKTPGSPFGDFVLNQGISKAVFEGRVLPTPESGLVVVESPKIKIPIPPVVQ